LGDLDGSFTIAKLLMCLSGIKLEMSTKEVNSSSNGCFNLRARNYLDRYRLYKGNAEVPHQRRRITICQQCLI
jgi:hypothetical protein